MAMDIPLPGDTLFADSPNAGDPACRCSRCGQVIEEGTMPIRAWPVDSAVEPGSFAAAGAPSYAAGEYRYHPACVGMAVDPFDTAPLIPFDEGPDYLNIQ